MFFFPIIITSGALVYLMASDRGNSMQSAGLGMTLSNFNIAYILGQIIRNQTAVRFIVGMMDQVFNIIWKSGVQTILFLAGLQSISDSLYECASVEGASAWEKYWKITVPMVSPIILINVIYTIVDSFTDYNNSMLRYVVTCTFGKLQYTFGTTLAWLYFIMTFLILLAVLGLASRYVFYVNEEDK